ncbi:hypothetical protein C8Q77DRAFT_416776 [Trametes polyzona]|nr:hypothetical protein C8Q77DRAFT_416776 [Trametes polyzona]
MPAKIAAAAERSVQSLKKQDPSRVLYTAFDGEYDVRQRFRKRIDRDVLESNRSPALAIRSLEIVLKLAENILEHPTEPRYRRFKISNEKIKKLVVEPKGVLQLVVDLGFREQVVDFEPCYVFRDKNTNELPVGASMIKEALARERKKVEEENAKRAREEEERKAHEEKIHLQFLDDRQSVAARAQRERHTGYAEVKGTPRRKGNIATLHDKTDKTQD